MNEAPPPSATREALALVHHHPGRLRVRAEAFRSGDQRPGQPEDAVARVRAALEVEPGISAVSHKPRTGSVLVEYQPGLADPEAILARIAAAAGLERVADDALTRPREPALVAIDAAREANELVAEITGYQTDLRALIPAGMAALAVYSFAYEKEARMPRWDNLLYWSYNIFSQLHRREIAAAGGAARHVSAAVPGPEPVSGDQAVSGDHAVPREPPARGSKPAS